jgi:hypothetical protein
MMDFPAEDLPADEAAHRVVEEAKRVEVREASC